MLRKRCTGGILGDSAKRVFSIIPVSFLETKNRNETAKSRKTKKRPSGAPMFFEQFPAYYIIHYDSHNVFHTLNMSPVFGADV